MNTKKIYEEMKKKISDIHNAKVFMSTNSIETDSKTLNSYSSYLSAKIDEKLFKTIRLNNWLMLLLGIINIILFAINVWILATN